MKASFTTAVVALSLLSTHTALAGGESGLYIGGGVGQSTITAEGDVPGGGDFSGNSGAWKAIVGYNFGVVPLIDLAVEGSYVDMGSPTDGSAEITMTGWDAFGLAGFNLGPVGLFAKAGAIRWDTDLADSGINYSSSGTDAAYGLGARIQIFSITGRAEVEYFDVNDLSDAYMVSVSALYTF